MDSSDIVSTLKYATVGSSFLFLTNSYHLYLKKDNLYSLAFFTLFLSSVQFHYSQNEFYEIIDKLVVYIVVIVGGIRLFYNWQHSLLHYFVVATFLGTVYMYWIGYTQNTCVWHPDRYISYTWHVMMHALGSLGHHTIALLLPLK